MKNYDLEQTLYGLQAMGFQWSQLSVRTRDLLGQVVYTQAMYWVAQGPRCTPSVSTVIYSLGKLGCMWEELGAPVRASLLVG
eukprot:gene19319-26361_t